MPKQNHNPMEPHATIAQWHGDKLTLHDATQYISGVQADRRRSARDLPEDNVRVICPFTRRRFRLQRLDMVARGAGRDGGKGRPPSGEAGCLSVRRCSGRWGHDRRLPARWYSAQSATERSTAIQHDCYSRHLCHGGLHGASGSADTHVYASPNIATSQKIVRSMSERRHSNALPANRPAPSPWKLRWTSWPAKLEDGSHRAAAEELCGK